MLVLRETTQQFIQERPHKYQAAQASGDGTENPCQHQSSPSRNDENKYRLTKPDKPQTNGIVRLFNERISYVLGTRRYNSSENLEQATERCCWLYGHHVPQKALHYRTPIAAMEEWEAE
ncbi:MAG: integrase core domain-containing protein [Cobetia amphilecti]